jgi:mevalonate kinase
MMIETTATAPGKIILFGEHSVVYGQPALAVPIHHARAEAQITSGDPGTGLSIHAEDLNLNLTLKETAEHGLCQMARLVLDALNRDEPDIVIWVRSSIPIAGGMGSGAAVSAALGKALSQHLGEPLPSDRLSALVYEVEKVYHGTPSGIDNTVICFEQPVYFIKGQAVETFGVAKPFDLVIGDTGVPSPTKETVGAVREAWLADPQRYGAIFGEIGEIVRRARLAIEAGRFDEIGGLMNQNQEWLRKLNVSSPELETLIEAAVEAGAAGAKLSGGGGGGNMIALVKPEQVEEIGEALREAGAVRVIHTVVS